MYQRQGKSAFKKDLKNIKALCKLLGNPEKRLNCVHIAGTNGKGTTAHFIASILMECGFKVGLYTSPHYKDFRERIKINGRPIDKSYVVSFTKRIQPHLKNIQASFFEITVAMAFDAFRNQKVDFAIIETGLGGRLDSTNVINPLVSVITNISFDHMHMLGNTLPKIAKEKAGIIKKEKPVVIGEYQKTIYDVFKSKAAEKKSKIKRADKLIKKDNTSFWYNEMIRLPLKDILPGPYQKKNVRTALATIKILEQQKHLPAINKSNVQNGIKNVVKNAAYQGRWQIISRHPDLILDSAHNEAGLTEVLNQIKQLNYTKLHFVLGFVKDKKVDDALRLFPKNAQYYFVEAKIPRALSKNDLLAFAERQDLQGKTYSSVKKGLSAAKMTAESTDGIFVLGSIFVVAEVIH